MRYWIFVVATFSLIACSDSEFAGGSGTKSRNSNTGNSSNNGGLNIISEPSNEHGTSVEMNPQRLDLSSFKDVSYPETFGDEDPNKKIPKWTVSEDGFKIVQENNADASIFYGDTVAQDYSIEGQWQTLGDDNDYMGFVFGMKNTDEFYLFQWKKAKQTSNGCTAEKGMQVRKMSLNGSHSQCDFWNSSDTNKAKKLFHNDIPWERNKTYKFKLVFHPGNFSIEVSDAETNEVLDSFTVKDDSYKSGKFGFYNYSQPKIEYTGFAISEIPPEIYTYQVETDADESVAVSYKLAEKPAGMTIDKNSGLVSWKADSVESGKYEVVVVAEGDNGSSAEQVYEIDLKK